MVTMESGALETVRVLAEHRLPDIVVTDESRTPRAVLPASQVVRFLGAPLRARTTRRWPACSTNLWLNR